jgi:hypothetical protein
LTLLFWGYNWGILTDVSSMSKKEIYEKLYYDVVLDVENYNHVIPITLLSLEFLVNNIEFSLC